MKKLILLMVLFSVFLIGTVFATNTATIVAPANGGTLDGSGVDINITFIIDNNLSSVNCAAFLSSPSTANSSTTKDFINLTNTTTSGTLNNMTINYTLATSDVIEDSDDYTLAVTCYNGSHQFSATSKTGIIVDRTTPSAPTTTSADETEFNDDTATTITYTVTGTDTTSCRIAFLDDGATPRFTGTNTFAMTHSGNSCTYTVTSNTIPNQQYNVYVQASDGTDTTNSVMRNFKIVTYPTGGATEDDVNVGVGLQFGDTEKLKKVGMILILLFGGYYLLFYKKKK